MIKRLYSKPLEKILFKREEEKKNIKRNFNLDNYRTLSQDFGLKNKSNQGIVSFRNQSNDIILKQKSSFIKELGDLKSPSKMKLHKRGKSSLINSDGFKGKINYLGIKNNYYSPDNFPNKKVKVKKLEIDF